MSVRWVGLAPAVDRRRSLVDEIPECGCFAVHTYWRCDLRCAYCITGSQGRSEPRVDPERLPALLRAELAAVPADALLGLGSLSDAYPSVEATLGVTRLALAELARQRRRVTVVTKGATVVRDIDLLRSMASTVTVSLCSVDEEALARIDPGAPGAARRLSVAAELHQAGLSVWIAASPWIPGVSDAEELVERVRGEVGDVPVVFAPLNVRAPAVRATAFGRRYDQARINRQYLIARAGFGDRRGVRWLRPVPLQGRHSRQCAFDAVTDGDLAGIAAHLGASAVPAAP